MASLTLEQVFGVGSAQDATYLTIQKDSLIGLVPFAENTPDSILAAIVNTAWQIFEGVLTDENGIAVTDENGVPVTYDNHLYYGSGWVMFWGYTLPPGKINSIFLFSILEPYTPS